MNNPKTRRNMSAKTMRQALNQLADIICRESDKFDMSLNADTVSIAFNDCTINITVREGGAR